MIFYWPARGRHLDEFHLVAACPGDLVRMLSSTGCSFAPV